ncbi:MAG: hypothetical protein AAF492_28455, partial [Verrucomicrobiota bacterium]
YPVDNRTDYVPSYEASVTLRRPMTDEQFQTLQAWEKQAEKQAVLFIEVIENEERGQFLGRLLGYGDYPNGRFQSFTLHDLNENNFKSL